MSNELTIELCADSGCGLYVANLEKEQHRISLMPNECIEARALVDQPDQLREFLIDIDPGFGTAIDALGIDTVATAIREKPLPSILKKMAGEE